MALTFVRLFYPTQLTTVVATIYTCPASPNTSVLKNGRVRFTNTTSSAVTATMYAVPSGGSAGVTNMCMNAQCIGPNSYTDVDVPTLGAGDTLQALAGANSSVTIHELGGVIYS